MIVSSRSCFLMISLSLSLSLTHWLTLSRASYELEMCRRDGVWAGNQYSARYMEVCNLITLSFSGLSLNRPNQTSQPELYFRYYPITSILRHTKANNITKGRYWFLFEQCSFLLKYISMLFQMRHRELWFQNVCVHNLLTICVSVDKCSIIFLNLDNQPPAES